MKGWIPVGAPRPRGPQLAVYVVSTTFRWTTAALDAAARYARRLGARIVLLVPQVVPYADPLDRPSDSTSSVVEHLRQLVVRLQIDATIQVCLCRTPRIALDELLPADAIVLVGGRRRRWWHTREQQLAVALACKGRHVLLIPGTLFLGRGRDIAVTAPAPPTPRVWTGPSVVAGRTPRPQ
ncbi:MAG: hypothetical protein ABUS56_00720 [Acidobacteriota bacterium]